MRRDRVEREKVLSIRRDMVRKGAALCVTIAYALAWAFLPYAHTCNHECEAHDAYSSCPAPSAPQDAGAPTALRLQARTPVPALSGTPGETPHGECLACKLVSTTKAPLAFCATDSSSLALLREPMHILLHEHGVKPIPLSFRIRPPPVFS